MSSTLFLNQKQAELCMEVSSIVETAHRKTMDAIRRSELPECLMPDAVSATASSLGAQFRFLDELAKRLVDDYAKLANDE